MSKVNVMQKSTYELIINNLNRLDVDLDRGVVKNKRVSMPNGYPQVFIKTRYVKVHQIIAVILWGDKCIGKQVNHKDGDKTNNKPENLELVTPAENNLHAYKLGLQYPKIGSMNGSAKLTENEVYEIKNLLKRGVKGAEIARLYGVSKDTISLIKRGKTWVHVK